MHYFAALMLAALGVTAMADELPVLRKGMSEFNRTVDGGDGNKYNVTAESDSAYRVDVETQQSGKTTQEVLVARRIGDC